MAEKRDSDNLSYSQLHAGDEFHALCCTRCAKNKRNKPSVKYCTVCSEYFCKDCLINHDSFPVMAKHPTVDTYTDGQSSRTTDDKMYAVPTEFCPHHPLKVIDMYCRSENVVGCSVCFNLEHKFCDDIHYITKYVVDNDPQQTIHSAYQQLSETAKSISGLQTKFDKYDKDFEKSKAECKQEINQYRKEINDTINDIEKRTLAELETKYNRCKQYNKKQNVAIQDMKSDLKRYLCDLVSEQVNLAQKFVLAIMGQRLVQQSEEMQSRSVENQTSVLKFSRSTEILAFLLNILTLGMLSSPENQNTMETDSRDKQTRQPTSITAKTTASTTTASTTTTSTTTASTTTTSTTTTSGATGSNIGTENIRVVKQQSKKQGLYKVVNKSMYKIKQSDDSNTCNILSSCITNNGDILLVDTNNKKIKLVDSKTYNIISSLLCDARPLSVCNVSSTEVVVCLDNNTIQFVSTCNNLVVTRSLSMKHACRCITVSRDRMYICDNTSLYIYNMNGTLINTIKEIKSGDKIFSHICDITISDDHNMIHIVDLYKGVITLDMNGKICWEFSGEVLNRAYGVCTDGSGNVIVCDRWSNNVILLGQNGDYMGEIVTIQNGVICPQTVCYNNNKLIVGCIDNNITVFTVK
ncbi:interferon-beta production [Mactra antiquata]